MPDEFEKRLRGVEEVVSKQGEALIMQGTKLDQIGESLKELVELTKSSVRAEQQIKECEKDIDTAFHAIRELENKQPDCNVHTQQIRACEARLSRIEEKTDSNKREVDGRINSHKNESDKRDFRIILAILAGSMSLITSLMLAVVK